MALPLVRLVGAAHAQGLQHGEALRERIRHNLAVYFERFEREARLSRAEVLERAGRYFAAIERHTPGYAQAVRGVAEGAGLPLLEVAALNVRYELLYYQFGVNAMADGCTAFALLPEATTSGHLLIGENWDWIPEVQGAVLHTTEPDGLQTLGFTEAGIVGSKLGLNSAGVGLAINGLTSSDDDWARLSTPFHARCYQILRSHSFDAALNAITGEDRACSANFLLAQAPDRALDVEAAPNGINLVHCERGCAVHANHFVNPGALGITEPPDEKIPHTYWRHERLRQLLDAERPVSLEALQAALRDHQHHPYSLCRHEDPAEPPEERYLTVTSAIMNLHTLELLISDGPPCVNHYTSFKF